MRNIQFVHYILLSNSEIPSAPNSEELEFVKGDILYVLDQTQMTKPGKWKGECNGQIGYFSPNSVKIIQVRIFPEKKKKTKFCRP